MATWHLLLRGNLEVQMQVKHALEIGLHFGVGWVLCGRVVDEFTLTDGPR